MKPYPCKNHALNTTRQNVLWRLYQARLYKEQFHPAMDCGFLPMCAFRGVDCGDSADRRLRELREIHGVPIEIGKFNTGGKRELPAYRLGCKPDALDWQKIVEQGSKWRFNGATMAGVNEPVYDVNGQVELL